MPKPKLGLIARKKQLGKVTYSGPHKGTFVVTKEELAKIGQKTGVLESWFDPRKKTTIYRLIDSRMKRGTITDRKA